MPEIEQTKAKARRIREHALRMVHRANASHIGTGLSMADEPFLERALDDRDAQVRRRAAELLAGLPDSRLAARLTAAAGSILTLKDGALNPVFPAAVNDALWRDGVTRPLGPADDLGIYER